MNISFAIDDGKSESKGCESESRVYRWEDSPQAPNHSTSSHLFQSTQEKEDIKNNSFIFLNNSSYDQKKRERKDCGDDTAMKKKQRNKRES